ncbi:hypothetical protein JCM3770_000129, partial [Rhodotorula araucariae]
VWLHRGAYGCAEDLAMGRPTLKYVNYAMHRVRMLKHYGVTPVLVFDGGLLPSKMVTEDAREAKRRDALARGRAFVAEGKGAQARECFVKAVDVTPAMAFQLIKALRREGIQYVVAPYEADPQLAYLEKAGLVDAVVTEDSDLLVFGCRNVLFKLDGEGSCVAIARDDLARCREYNFAGWGDTEFRQMAILSGCDYLESVVGLGLKTAYRLLRKYKTPEKVIQFLRIEGQLTVPRTYLDEFRRAERTFLHQHVFDPVSRKLTHLTPLPEGTTAEDLPFIGPLLDEDFARGIAEGTIDPITKLAMVDLVPDSSGPSASGVSPPPSSLPSTSLLTASSDADADANRPQPYKPAPFTRTPVAGAAKPSAGSLLSYFSRAPAANPARAAPPRVVLVGRQGGDSARAAAAADEPKRTSRFFGAAAPPARAALEMEQVVVSKGKGKGKARAGDDADERADDSGFIDCIELPPSSDTDAEDPLRDVELSVELRSVLAVEDAEAIAVANNGAVLEADDRHLARARSPSLPPAISSPVATPPRTRVKRLRSHSPLAGVAGTASDAGVSSPAASTVAQAGWEADADQGALSSPVPAAVVKLETRPTPTAHTVPPSLVKRERARGNAVAALAPIELSSDPIVLSSDAPMPRPPKREAKPPRKPKAPARSAEGKVKPSPRRGRDVGVEVRADEEDDRSSSERKKGKKRRRDCARNEDDDEDGIDEAVKAVAASWRAKFMMPAANKTPLGRSALGRPLPTTPQTTTRPPSTETRRMLTTTSPKKKQRVASAAKTGARLPLSPRSTNRLTTAPPPRKASPLVLARGPASHEDDAPVQATKERQSRVRDPLPLPIPSSDNAADAQSASASSSSSPVVVTNPRLLAFRFTGTVRRE